MISVLRSIWIWTATSALTLSWVPVVATVRLFDRDPLRKRTARWFRRLGPLVAKVNPWRLHISGREHITANTTFVVVSNHQSLADIPLISHLKIDAKWLGKAELLQVPVFGWMMKMAGDIPVERGDRRKAAQALLQCARVLRQRVSLVFFPEGTRSPNGEILPFNDGPFQLALRERVPVLPIVVEGSGSALPRSSWIFRGTSDIYLRVLPPVPMSDWPANQVGELREKIRGMMAAELEVLRALHAEGID